MEEILCGRRSVKLAFLLGLVPLLAGGVPADDGKGVRMIYATSERNIIALGYDQLRQTSVALVNDEMNGRSMLRRIRGAGSVGEVIATIPREATCSARPCTLQILSSSYLDALVLMGTFGVGPRFRTEVYQIPRRGGGPKLLARTRQAWRPQYPEEIDELEPGVAGFASIETIMAAEEPTELLVNGRLPDGSPEIKTYVLDLTSNTLTRRLEGRVIGRRPAGLIASKETTGWVELMPAQARRAASAGTAALLREADPAVVQVVELNGRRAEVRRNPGIGNRTVYLRTVTRAAGQGETEGEGVPVHLPGCAIPFVAGVWPTPQGTLIIAADCEEKNTSPQRAGPTADVHRLYEVP